MEGTQIKPANEIDIQVAFKGLRRHPLSLPAGSDAMKLVVPKSCSVLSPYTDRDGVFNYPLFFHLFLREVKAGLTRIRSRLHPGLSVLDGWTPCPRCQSWDQEDGTVPLEHCRDCLPAVTHTRVGACLIFEYEERLDRLRTVLTVDLVPVYPLRGNERALDLYDDVFWTLYSKRPQGWEDYCLGVADKEKILLLDGVCREIAIKFVN